MSDQIDQAIHETRDFLAARRAPDLTAAVMSRVADITPLPSSQRAGLLRRLGQMLWAPREFSIRPAYALAAAACVAIILVVLVRQLPSSVPQLIAVDDPQLFVQFRLDTAASRVQLAGTFTNWEPRYDLHQSAPGIWTITLPLKQGVHDYSFVVDGQRWVPDPSAPHIGDGFGGTNSRLALLPPTTPTL
jgi:Glycogen recognition site of AMP-activated protein kinase